MKFPVQSPKPWRGKFHQRDAQQTPQHSWQRKTHNKKLRTSYENRGFVANRFEQIAQVHFGASPGHPSLDHPLCRKRQEKKRRDERFSNSSESKCHFRCVKFCCVSGVLPLRQRKGSLSPPEAFRGAFQKNDTCFPLFCCVCDP